MVKKFCFNNKKNVDNIKNDNIHIGIRLRSQGCIDQEKTSMAIFFMERSIELKKNIDSRKTIYPNKNQKHIWSNRY